MRIVFTGGGTLGSVTPLLAVAEAIRRRQPSAELVWIGTKDGPEQAPVERAGLRFIGVSAGKLRRYFAWRNFTDLFRVLAGFFQCRRLFRAERPDRLVSAGGFVAVPAVWAARSLGVPIHVHQMDIRPGLANRLAAPFARSVSVAYRESMEDFAKYNPVWIGNPVRAAVLSGDRNAGLARWRLSGQRPIVLMLGGGTGAESLNRLAVKAWDFLREDIDLIHVTGLGKAIVVATDEHYRQVESLNVEEMGLAYAVADLVITRAGMGTLTELAALGKPTVIVPIPNSHQEENAAFFASNQAAEVWPENELFSKSFADRLLRLTRDRGQRDSLSTAIRGLNRPEAAERMADIVLR